METVLATQTTPRPTIHVRQLLSPSEPEIQQVLHTLRLAFQDHPVLRLVLNGDLSPERVDALHLAYVRAALVPGEGEVWVAETTEEAQRRLVGVAIWFLPGKEFLGSERQRQAVRWEETVAPMLGERGNRWFFDYYEPQLAAMWERSSLPSQPTPRSSYFICKVGVLPSHHSSGVAKALVLPILGRAEREGNVILGQATSEEERRTYEAVGCRMRGEGVFWPVGGEVEGVKIWASDMRPEASRVYGHRKRSGDTMKAKL